MVSASHWVGLTLPGMIDDPGSFSGSDSSPSPERGPDPSRRMSLAILNRLAATVFNAPWVNTMASCAASASNLLGAEVNGRPVISAILAATFSAKPTGALRPVPTAVPPCASCISIGSDISTRTMPLATCCTYPENSWPSVNGVASWVWVRPILMMCAQALALESSASRSVCSAPGPDGA